MWWFKKKEKKVEKSDNQILNELLDKRVSECEKWFKDYVEGVFKECGHKFEVFVNVQDFPEHGNDCHITWGFVGTVCVTPRSIEYTYDSKTQFTSRVQNTIGIQFMDKKRFLDDWATKTVPKIKEAVKKFEQESNDEITKTKNDIAKYSSFDVNAGN